MLVSTLLQRPLDLGEYKGQMSTPLNRDVNGEKRHVHRKKPHVEHTEI